MTNTRLLRARIIIEGYAGCKEIARELGISYGTFLAKLNNKRAFSVIEIQKKYVICYTLTTKKYIFFVNVLTIRLQGRRSNNDNNRSCKND